MRMWRRRRQRLGYLAARDAFRVIGIEEALSSMRGRQGLTLNKPAFSPYYINKSGFEATKSSKIASNKDRFIRYGKLGESLH